MFRIAVHQLTWNTKNGAVALSLKRDQNSGGDTSSLGLKKGRDGGREGRREGGREGGTERRESDEGRDRGRK